MNRVLLRRPAILSACAAMGLSVSALAADLSIADIAPKDSIVVVSIDDYSQMRTAFDRTGFKEIWTDPGMQKWFDRQAAEFFADFEEALDDLGLEKDDIKPPHGMAGGAMWFVMNEETDEPEPRVLIAADYADEAEAMSGVFSQLMDEGLERDQITVDEDEYAGVTIYTITPLEAGEEMEEEDEWAWEDDSSGMFDFENQEMYYARSGNILFISSDKRALENSIDRAAGKDLDSVRDNADYAKSIAQVGGHHMSASFLVGPMMDMMKQANEAARADMDDEFAMMMPDPLMMMNAAGIDEVKAVTFGANFDADAGMLEQTWSIICPEKRGLVSLFDNPAIDNTPPAFIPAGATSYSSFQFRFADLLPKLREIANTMPDEMKESMLQGLGMAEGFVGPMLAQMEPQVIIAQSYTRPFSPESQSMLVGMKAKDQAKFNDAVVNLVNSGMMPLQSRDFLGNTIWEMDPSMAGMGAPPIAIGIGGGHVFFGKPTDIENALRAADADNASLAEEDDFKAAAKSVGANSMGFTYTDMRSTIEYLDWTMRNYEQIVRAQFSGPDWENDPEMKEFAEEMVQDAMENMPTWMKDAPPLDVVMRNIGDMAGQLRSTPDGFIMKSVVLRPNN